MIRAEAVALAVLAAMLAMTPARAADPYQPGLVSPAQEQRLGEARDLRRAGRAEDAITRLKELVAENPDYYLASYNLALAYAEQSKYKEASAAFEKTAELQRKHGIKDPTLYNSWGWAQLLSSDYKAAEKSLKSAEQDFAALPPASQQRLLNNLGVLYMYKRDYGKAETYLQRSVSSFNSSLAQENLNALNSVRRAKAAQ